jgi:hypothetical protein
MQGAVTLPASDGAHGGTVGQALAGRRQLPFVDRVIPAAAAARQLAPPRPGSSSSTAKDQATTPILLAGPGSSRQYQPIGGEKMNGTKGKDKDHDLIWFVEACLDNAMRLEDFFRDADRAHDPELAELFRKAQADSRKGARMGKELLVSRLTATET